MGADTISLSGLEKDVYENAISEGVNNSFDLKDWFKMKELEYNGGAGQVWNHHHGRNVSPFFANEDSAYPVAGNQNSSKGRIKAKKVSVEDRQPVAEPTGPARVRMTLPPPTPCAVQILGEGPAAAPAVVDILERRGVLSR